MSKLEELIEMMRGGPGTEVLSEAKYQSFSQGFTAAMKKYSLVGIDTVLASFSPPLGGEALVGAEAALDLLRGHATKRYRRAEALGLVDRFPGYWGQASWNHLSRKKMTFHRM